MRPTVGLLLCFCSASLLTALALGADSDPKAEADKYTLQVPGGLAFSEFRGYESWPVIAISENNGRISAIVGNPTIIRAYQAGIPGNGKPFPDGSKMAKIHWIPKRNETAPGQPVVPGMQHDVDFMVKDSRRFPDAGGWGYAAFEYNAADDQFTPGTETDKPPQGHDAKCGAVCHTAARNRDYVFTDYAHR